MLIIGCDYHPSVQHIAWIDSETGECNERQLRHSDGEAEKFYRDLQAKGVNVRVGIEATGHARWFERWLAELEMELWVGDPAPIKAAGVRKQKNDRQDAEHILKLMMEDRFPRIWVPGPDNRDLRQRLWHRHRLVQMRTRVMNQLQAVAMNEGVRRKKGLWSQSGRKQLESFQLAPWATRRRQDLLQLVDQFNSLHRGVNGRHRAASRAVSGCATFDDSSWGGSDHRPGVCVDHRISGALWLRQADRQLPGADPVRGFQRGPAAAGSHQQAGQHTAAFLAGGGGASRRPWRCRLATSVSAPGDATRT